MKVFIKKIVFLSIPFILIFLCPLYILLCSGELTPIRRIIKKQDENMDSIYGARYSYHVEFYKHKMTLLKAPEFLVLGSSRVMQFRSDFLNNDIEFYNAGGGVGRISHIRDFLEEIPIDRNPKVVVLGLDHYFFNRRWDPIKGDDNYLCRLKKDIDIFNIFHKSWRCVYEDLYDRNITFDNLLNMVPWNQCNFGLTSIIRGDGFRHDGSYYYKFFIERGGILNCEECNDYRFKDTIRRINDGNDRFQYGTEVNSRALEELDEALALCSDRNIYVIGFLPPFAHTIWKKLESMRDKYGYIFELPIKLEPLFLKYQYDFYDFSDVVKFGSSDAEVIDGFHGSEKAYLRLFIEMLDKNRKLHNFADIEDLKEALRQANSNFMVF